MFNESDDRVGRQVNRENEGAGGRTWRTKERNLMERMGAMKSEDYGTDNLHLPQTMRLRQSEARVTTAKRLTLNGKNKGAPSENKKMKEKDGVDWKKWQELEKWKNGKKKKKPKKQQFSHQLISLVRFPRNRFCSAILSLIYKRCKCTAQGTTSAMQEPQSTDRKFSTCVEKLERRGTN